MKNARGYAFDAWAALIVFAVALTSAVRLSITEWAKGIELPTEAAALGVLLGLALSQSRFRRGTALFFEIAYGILLLPLLFGFNLYPRDVQWLERLASLAGRLAHSAGLLVQRQPVYDPLLFLLLACLLYWSIGLAAGNLLFRRGNYLAAALPGGLAMVVVQFYDPAMARIGLLAVYLFLSLLLLGRLNYIDRRMFWKARHVALPAETGTDLNISIVAAATVLVVAAWLIPLPAKPVWATRSLWRQVSEAVAPEQEDLGNLLAGLENTQAPAGRSASLYGDSLELGEQAAEGNTQVFTVSLPGVYVPRFYWRVRTYDLYEVSQWNTDPLASREFSPADDTLEFPNLAGLQEAAFTFEMKVHNVTSLVAPSHTFWVSRPVQVQGFRLEGGQLEPVLFTSPQSIPAGEQYRVQAYLSNPTVTRLRQAGSEYPEWVASRYLQLPADFPPRVAELARSLTEGLETPYDKAQAITDYLRGTIVYSRTVEPAPRGADPLEWFLFESRQGYCNYYATAGVLMLRSVGVPARLAVGYSQGSPQPGDPSILQVARSNAHAWPEVYFPGLDWVEFEPTAAQPPLLRPVEREQTKAATPAPLPPEHGLPEQEEAPLPQEEAPATPGTLPVAGPVDAPPYGWLAALAVGAALFTAAALAWRRRITRAPVASPLAVRIKAGLDERDIPAPRWLADWALRAGQAPAQRAFSLVYRALRRLGGSRPPSMTPAEAAGRLQSLLPGAAPAIATLLDEYQALLYSARPGNPHLLRPASQALRSRIRRYLLVKYWHRLSAPFLRKSRAEEHET
ncbi:MAG: DUF4129 domain-containing protein [Chloroflexi bacterium]|nr:DUF4129 domain-containing protein [Chloroflexota bacterium]